MKNTMTTYVKIKGLNEENFLKVRELFETENDNSSYVKLTDHFNQLFGEQFNDSDNVIGREWMERNIGSKWIQIEFGDAEYSPETDLVIESTWNVPTGYIQRVRDVLTEWDKDITLSGTYEDMDYSPIGAFVYAFDYDDIEDYDEEVSLDEMMGDDEYNERVYGELYSLRDDLYEVYLEVKKERE
jgi:hypothetical protein